MDVEVERDNLKRYDMTDFSAKNKTPEPQEPKDLADVVAVLEVLPLLGTEAVPELVAWIDDRFETFRSHLAQGNMAAAESIRTHFQFNHESYARVVQRVTRLKVEAALKLSAPTKPSSRMKKAKARTTNSGARQGRGVPVPPEVVAALPIRKGKKLCMKFLSIEGFPGEGDTCVFDYRGHFVPAKLPVTVRNFISKNYGGLRDTSAPAAGSQAEV
ncbi:uncharacterized protein PITG_17626 [Phytophthora infestans T30-4]|uniref:Uncharacterized protein n=1 Tax=Phytophthora infestans (strain T30-4) TaxID=403677 RepID=D0NWT8_PHYIT|nr:uncharacterized protein PITG_17626 [Phytophthora infestans T30-4]EEY67521.1 conserved hypothetical protein [Phytophthora infestans T30-4]KAI9981796.1 hypothetical protein PInf_009566 [Phytophthora infestans]|eukprot:XP_002896494.1 conserved hypothetical protein [Phytophthora infestans T30-4]